ncbi:MAG: GDSL-type esterase/lipase family protein [bacterium]
MAHDSLGKRAGAVLVGVVLALALAEGLLQVAALVVRHRARASRELAAPRPPGGGPVVLCVGDSFTYGSGSTEAAMSYPGQLQTWLAAHGPAGVSWSVRNAGWPGRNSSELLKRLPAFLQETHPDYVCVLIGLNNRWSHRDAEEAGSDSVAASPAPASGAEETRWTWRLPRLFAITAAAVRQRFGPHAPATSPAPSPSADASGAPPAPSASDARIDVTDPRAALATVRERRGRTADVRPLLEALEQIRPRIREHGDPETTVALVLLLSDMNQYAQAVEEGELAKQRFGMTPALANALVQPLARLGRTAEAVELGRMAVADAPRDLDRLRRLAAALRMDKRPGESLAAFTKIFESTGDAVEYEKQLRKLDRSFLASDEKCTAALAELHLSDADRAATLQRIHAVLGELGVYQDVLPRDLARIFDLVQQSGARVVVVGYPGPDPANVTLRQAAEERGVVYVDVEATFDARVPEAEKSSYFVLDGHCNDRGYALVAEAVGRALLSLR